MDEDVELTTRHKKKLQALREKDGTHVIVGQNGRDREPISGGHSEASGGGIQGTQGPDEGGPGIAGPGEEGMAGSEGASGGHGTQLRHSEPAPLDATTGADRGNEPSRGDQLTVDLTPEQQEENERERNRQKQQRYRDRKREEEAAVSSSSNSNGYGYEGNAKGVTGENSDVTESSSNAKFAIKNPLKFGAKEPEKVKLFSEKEAKEELERLIYIYVKGSGLLDDLLEIVVKGHEPVQIWQLDEGEAEMLAQMHLDKAKKDQAAARSARALLSIYDRLFTIMMLGPRIMASGQHIKTHGGLSFK